MSMDNALLVVVALRDLRNMDVIKALDRLVTLPRTREELTASLADLGTVRGFIQQLPEQIQDAAKQMFVEHGRLIETHFREAQAARAKGD